MTNTGIIRLLSRLHALRLEPVRVRVRKETREELVAAWLEDGDAIVGAMIGGHSLFGIPFVDDDTIAPGEIRVELSAQTHPGKPAW